MLTIHLHNLKFHSFHGLYEEEKIAGNDFELNVNIALNSNGKIKKLGDTVDYVDVYEIIKNRMAIPTALLETVAQDLAQLIYEYDTRIRTIDISIKKLHPPIANFTGNVGVSYKAEF